MSATNRNDSQRPALLVCKNENRSASHSQTVPGKLEWHGPHSGETNDTDVAPRSRCFRAAVENAALARCDIPGDDVNWFGADNGFWDSIAAFRPGRSAETQRRVADMRGWARDLAERATKQSRAEAADTFSTSLAIRDLADAIDR